MVNKEEWSLKGKLLRSTKTETGNPTIGRSLPVMSFYVDSGILMSVGRYYAKCDIDTLREKLINDIENLSTPYEEGRAKKENLSIKRLAVEIINRRFGIDG